MSGREHFFTDGFFIGGAFCRPVHPRDGISFEEVVADIVEGIVFAAFREHAQQKFELRECLGMDEPEVADYFLRYWYGA